MSDNKLNIFQQVRALEGWQAVAFATTLLERMLPNYQLFCELTHFEGAEQYRKTLNGVWEWLSVPKMKMNFEVHLEKVESCVPDAADFDNFGVYPAIDVAMSMSALLLMLMGEDEQGAVVVSKLSQGSVDAFISATTEQELSGPDLKAHPLMQWEIAFQQELLDTLAKASRQPETIKALKKMATEDGVSNLGLEIPA